MKIKITKCPYCGGKRNVLNHVDRKYWVRCVECGCHSGLHGTSSKALRMWKKEYNLKYNQGWQGIRYLKERSVY